MASEFVQRQFNGFVGVGEVEDPVRVGIAQTVWQNSDVVPSTILKLDPGLFSETTTTVSAALSETHTVSLPANYTSASRLSFTLKTDQNLRITLVSPDHPTSTVLVYVPEDSSGFYSVIETVTSITIVNTSDTDATVEYVCFSYPDLLLPASWQGGIETLGVSSS